MSTVAEPIQSAVAPWTARTNLLRLVPIGLNLSLVVVGAVAVYLHIYHVSLMAWICREDGLVENSEVMLDFAAAVLFGIAAVRAGRAGIFLWGLALLNFFFAGEEISWGQRILGIAEPGWLGRINEQHELTVHNIEGLQGNHRWMGLVFIFVICILVPVADRLIPACGCLFRRYHVPIFPLWAAGILAMGVLFMAVSRWVTHQVVGDMDEMGELYLAIAFFVWAIAERAMRIRRANGPANGERPRGKNICNGQRISESDDKGDLTQTREGRIPGELIMQPIHPGRILKRELKARGLSANRLALALRVPSGRITSLLNSKRSVTPETALRLARYFGNSAQFWLNLQTRYDLLTTEAKIGERIKAEIAVAT